MKFPKYFLVFFSLFLFLSTCVNSSFAISIPEEKEVAKKFIAMIKKQNMILNDPIANHMINQIGKHILSFLPPQSFDYSFYIVNDDVFNAFAGPGAHIFAYRGLITSLDSIDELAGIVGHEIAHAASRHVSESIDRSKIISMGSLAGMLAGIIIGSNSDNGEAGAAVIHGSLAMGHTAMLAFTRENETEADEKGIMFLKRSCFSPQGLLLGLEKIRASDFRGVEKIPDYVKTHPGTRSRIAHAETILSGYTPPQNKVVCPSTFEFNMVKYRLLGLYADIETTFNLISTRLNNNPADAALHYGMGLIYARKFRKEESLSHLKKALAINIFDPMILLELGRVYLLYGEPEKALDVLEGIEEEPVLGLMAKFYQASAHLELQNLTIAEILLNTVIDKAPSLYPKAYYNLANIMSIEKRLDLSHYYLGVYYSEIKRRETAIVHLRKALDMLSDEAKRKKAKTILNRLKKQAANDLREK